MPKDLGYMMNRRTIIFYLMFYALVSAVCADDNVSLDTPRNTASCVVGPNVEMVWWAGGGIAWDECKLFHNNSGNWVIEKLNYSVSTDNYNIFHDEFDVPNTILWGVQCLTLTPSKTEWSESNFTFTLTDAPYCAVLSSTNCTQETHYGSPAVFTFVLANTLGDYLENQDCNLWIQNSDGIIVKSFDTLMSSQGVTQQLDDDGNWINVADKKVPLTDSLGRYLFEWMPDRSFMWQGETYTIHANCNGQTTNCQFTAREQRAVDINEAEVLTKKFSGMIVGLLMALILGCVIVGVAWNSLKTGRVRWPW